MPSRKLLGLFHTREPSFKGWPQALVAANGEEALNFSLESEESLCWVSVLNPRIACSRW